jgi:hypothetical protein
VAGRRYWYLCSFPIRVPHSVVRASATDRWLGNNLEIPRIIPDILINMAGNIVRQVVTELRFPLSDCYDLQTFSELGVSREIKNYFRVPSPFPPRNKSWETCDVASGKLHVLANVSQRKLELHIGYTSRYTGKRRVSSPRTNRGSSWRGLIEFCNGMITMKKLRCCMKGRRLDAI